MKTFNVTRENKEEIVACINILPNMIIEDNTFFCMTTDKEIAQLICEIIDSPMGYDAYPGRLWCIIHKEGYDINFYSNCVHIIKYTSSIKIEEEDSNQSNDHNPCLPEEICNCDAIGNAYDYKPHDVKDNIDGNPNELFSVFFKGDEIGISLYGKDFIYLNRQHFTDEMAQMLFDASSAEELARCLAKVSKIFDDMSRTLNTMFLRY